MEKDNKIEGKVFIRFVVMEDGSVGDVTVSRVLARAWIKKLFGW